MTFPSLNLEMKVGVCITCEKSKSLPSLVGKVKKKFDPHLGMYVHTFFKITFKYTYIYICKNSLLTISTYKDTQLFYQYYRN
jgi:hypothetical protein